MSESEARFQRLADQAPDVIYRFDYLPERHFSYVSRAITAITGYTPEDYYADSQLGWRQLHPDDLPRYLEVLAKPDLLRDSIEMRWMHRDGRVVWVEQRNVPIVDHDGHLIAVEGIVRDISERRRTSEALRESEQRYRALVENMSQGVLVYQDGRVVFSNPALAQMIDCHIDDLYACPFEDLVRRFCIDIDDTLPLSVALQSNMVGGLNTERPFQIQRTDGEICWLNTQSTSTTYNGRPAILMVLSDVTNRKLTEERLRLSEARLHLLLDKTPAVIFSARAEGDFRTTFISESIRNLLGYEPTRFMAGTNFWVGCIHPDDRQRVFSDSVLFFEHGWRQYEYRCLHADGSYRWVENGVSLLPPVESHPAELIGYMIDITERKKAEEALREANAQLAHAARMKDAFLANMSHELRTPLNAILGRTELLQEQYYGPLSEAQRRSLLSIEESGRHLLVLINDILDLSKIEAGRLDLAIEEIVIAEMCQASLLFVKELAIKKSLALSLQLNNPLAYMQADPRRIKQMLINLLSNAVKFTPDGGRVCLEVRVESAANLVHFTVQDTGIGIASEDLPRLFQPFSQLDSTRSHQHEGSGLGLALVRRLSELHGGYVSIESVLGVGSQFTITLPIYQVQAGVYYGDQVPTHDHESHTLPSNRETPAFTLTYPQQVHIPVGLRVLLTDDNETNILVIDEYLRAQGFDVAIAHSGREALERVDAVQPMVILMDIQMPDLDGLEVIRHLRAQPAYASVPIIALTALAMPGDRERCLDAGANAYLAKPVSLKQLTDLILQVVRGV
ncbi:MAG: PAS domain S-box protein [Oscillochloris sp.]|nr:PAS domain S-box protein [Oscillochloris sp.]